MKTRTNILKKISRKEDLYVLNVDGINVEMLYAENNKSFNECMLEILKQKSRG